MRPLRVRPSCSSGTFALCVLLSSLTASRASGQAAVPIAAAPRYITTSHDTVFFFPATPDESADRTRRTLGYASATRSWFETRLRAERPEQARAPLPESASAYGASITVSTTDGDGSWFGLATTKGRAKGGVLYVDASGRIVPMLRDQFAEHDVSALALVGSALWVGTSRAAAGDHGTTGLVSFKRSDSTWTQFTSRSSPLPGNDILDLSALGEQLAIATDSGAAVLDPRTGLWQVRFFDQVVRNDSLVWMASMARPKLDSVVLAARRLSSLLGDLRLSSLTAAAESVNRDSLLGLVRVDGSSAPDARRRATIALSDVAFLPFLRRAIADDDPAKRQLASDALIRIKDSKARDVIHAFMDTAAVDRALGVVGQLAAQHDSLAMRWLHAKLADPRVRADTVPRAMGGAAAMSRLDTLISTIVHVGDESFVTQLLTLIDIPSSRRVLLGVMQLGPVAYQRQLSTLIGPRIRLWAPYFALFVVRDSGDAAPPAAAFGEDLAIRRALVTFARVALTRNDSALVADGVASDSARASLRTNAILVLAEWGGAPALPFLIDQMDRAELDALVLVQSVVQLAGVDGGPVFKRSDATPDQRVAVKRYWTKWWETNKAAFTPATRVASETALNAWRQRAGVR